MVPTVGKDRHVSGVKPLDRLLERNDILQDNLTSGQFLRSNSQLKEEL